jgi:NADH:ubiquinone oxidoreductase subunit 3 (subunit A)
MITLYNFEYLKILIFFLVSFTISFSLVVISLRINKIKTRRYHHRPVECGSHSFGSGRNRMEINFYMVAVLFIILEVEILLVIPWLVMLSSNIFLSWHVITLFILLLMLSLVFEAAKGAFTLKNKFYF